MTDPQIPEATRLQSEAMTRGLAAGWQPIVPSAHPHIDAATMDAVTALLEPEATQDA